MAFQHISQVAMSLTDLQREPRPGLTQTDGATATNPTVAISKGALVASSTAPKPPSASLPSTLVTLAQDEKGRQNLTNLILQCFNALKTYGKEPEQLGDLNAMFQMVLEDYSIEQIKGAFKAHISRSQEIPTPSDIVTLIKRGGKPALEKSVYVALVQKRERTTKAYTYGTYDDLTAEESQYVKDYEGEMLNG